MVHNLIAFDCQKWLCGINDLDRTGYGFCDPILIILEIVGYHKVF